jgi:superfamily I DNA/RNA helicase
MQYTEEQMEVIQSRSPRLKVRAFAGSGKTSTAEAYTVARPNTRFLYIVFNKSAQLEAKARFPRNVTPKTSHGLAYQFVGRYYQHKLRNDLRAADIRAAIDTTGAMTYLTLRWVADTLKAYLSSSSQTIDVSHALEVLPKTQQAYAHRYAGLARDLWKAMCNRNNRTVSMIHDGYLKIFQLKRIDLAAWYDHIIMDEAQDLNPVTAQIVQDQRLPLMIIGDEHQSIYRFRKAVNGLASIPTTDSLSLTASFRFGPQIATLANSILMHYKGEQECLWGYGEDTAIEYVEAANMGRHTKIHRTFAETFNTAFLNNQSGRRVAWVGGVHAYPLNNVTDLYALMINREDQVRDRRLLADFPDYESYRDAAEQTEDPEMMRLIKIVEAYRSAIPDAVATMKREACEERDSNIVVTTAHRSKGMEWDQVVLADDFPDWHSQDQSWEEREDEANLAYVAVTRAQKRLILDKEQERLLMLPPPALKVAV